MSPRVVSLPDASSTVGVGGFSFFVPKMRRIVLLTGQRRKGSPRAPKLLALPCCLKRARQGPCGLSFRLQALVVGHAWLGSDCSTGWVETWNQSV